VHRAYEHQDSRPEAPWTGVTLLGKHVGHCHEGNSCFVNIDEIMLPGTIGKELGETFLKHGDDDAQGWYKGTQGPIITTMGICEAALGPNNALVNDFREHSHSLLLP